MALLVVIAACGHPDRGLGELDGHRVACGGQLSDSSGCRPALEQFFAENLEARIAGIDAVYRGGIELIVWTTRRSIRPRAKELTVAEVPCLRSPEGPDCLSAIDELWVGAQRDSHAFIVPLASEPEGQLGSWSFLDLRTNDASFPHPHVVEVPCRLEKGEPLLVDVGKGVMAAKELETVRSSDHSSSVCEFALTSYLRGHPDVRVRSIAAEDGNEGTRSLLVSTVPSSEQTPRARDLSVSSMACPSYEDCPGLFISLRNAGMYAHSLFSFPIGERLESAPFVFQIIIVSTID